ncbi:MAG: alpha/beta hydrolase, partial [Planctomycetota bacterium]
WQHRPERVEAGFRKGPGRYGPFKEVFQRDFLLVAGTRGSPEETEWARQKARYDAETFWYRGNGSVEILADTEYDATRLKQRNVILYGNASTNAAWDLLLGKGPVQVEPGLIRIGTRRVKGEDLACLFVRPHDNDPETLVGAVSGTGLGGMRLTDRLPYFVSGIHYPDVFVAGPDMLEKGSRGVRVAGFFGLDWSVENGDFAWR